MKTLDQRFEQDSQFHALVKNLENIISTAQFTPSELREALMYAQIRYERKNPRMTTFSPDLEAELKRILDKK